MPYMLLVIERPEERAGLTPAESQRRYDRMMGFAGDLQKRGVLVAGESLGSDAKGARLRKREGKRTLTDGPFAEAKEIVGGFFARHRHARRGDAGARRMSRGRVVDAGTA
ncbi:hypothetical protein BH10PSE9_BH10PSE9_07520 [soil metagenome]